jgi:hypothetical protein
MVIHWMPCISCNIAERMQSCCKDAVFYEIAACWHVVLDIDVRFGFSCA